MTGHAPVARLARPEHVHPPADPAAEHLPEGPGLLVLAHQGVEVVLGRLDVNRTYAEVTPGDGRLDLRLPLAVHKVHGERGHFQIRAELAEPPDGQVGLPLPDVIMTEVVPVDVV